MRTTSPPSCNWAATVQRPVLVQREKQRHQRVALLPSLCLGNGVHDVVIILPQIRARLPVKESDATLASWHHVRSKNALTPSVELWTGDPFRTTPATHEPHTRNELVCSMRIGKVKSLSPLPGPTVVPWCDPPKTLPLGTNCATPWELPTRDGGVPRTCPMALGLHLS